MVPESMQVNLHQSAYAVPVLGYGSRDLVVEQSEGISLVQVLHRAWKCPIQTVVVQVEAYNMIVLARNSESSNSRVIARISNEPVGVVEPAVPVAGVVQVAQGCDLPRGGSQSKRRC